MIQTDEPTFLRAECPVELKYIDGHNQLSQLLTWLSWLLGKTWDDIANDTSVSVMLLYRARTLENGATTGTLFKLRTWIEVKTGLQLSLAQLVELMRTEATKDEGESLARKYADQARASIVKAWKTKQANQTTEK